MKPLIRIVPIGPGNPELLTLQTVEMLQDTNNQIVLRTDRHPVATWLVRKGISFSSLDHFYEEFEDFDEMHRAMSLHLWKMAERAPVCFCVADPVSDGAVRSIRASIPVNAELSVLPGVGSADALLSFLPVGFSGTTGLTVISASNIRDVSFEPELDLLITEIDSRLLAGEIKLRLMDILPEDQKICFFPPSGNGSRPALILPLYQLDCQHAYDHTAAAFISGSDYLNRSRHTFSDLVQIMERLRAQDGCPWDKIQTHESLRPYIVEEAWEAVNAIDEADMDHLADELGDVLFQVVFHASIGFSFDEFTLTDVISDICQKMIRRHPHVFKNHHKETSQTVSDQWEKQKRDETGSRTVGETLGDVSSFLPALKYAIKCYKKLAQNPALKRDPEVIAKEIAALSTRLVEKGGLCEERMALMLMKSTELCFRSDCDAEILLHQGIVRMIRNYRAAEKEFLRKGIDPESLDSDYLTRILYPEKGIIDET